MNAQNLIRLAVAATWVASWAVSSGCATRNAQASPTAGAVASARPDAREVAAIRDVIQRYETALDASVTDDVLALYGSEPVFMAPEAAAQVGRDAVRACPSARARGATGRIWRGPCVQLIGAAADSGTGAAA